MKVTLPAGHEWVERKFNVSASETIFDCFQCGATFSHDMIDNSQHFEDGDGSCDPDADNGE